jgi:hypothetical protein
MCLGKKLAGWGREGGREKEREGERERGRREEVGRDRDAPSFGVAWIDDEDETAPLVLAHVAYHVGALMQKTRARSQEPGARSQERRGVRGFGEHVRGARCTARAEQTCQGPQGRYRASRQSAMEWGVEQ